MAENADRPSVEAERELVAGCQRGDAACWERLYVTYRRDAWRILARMLGPGDELEDLVQRVFIKVYRSLDRFEGRSRFTTWLYRICVHVAMDHLRRRQRRREVSDPQAAAALADDRADPGAALARREAAAELQAGLARLKPDKRQVLVLHDLMEVDTEEIARSLGIPAATVRTRLFYGRRALARQLARQRARQRARQQRGRGAP
jgi:RNA polymerase sigma-70 factor (ECF subfamily)